MGRPATTAWAGIAPRTVRRTTLDRSHTADDTLLIGAAARTGGESWRGSGGQPCVWSGQARDCGLGADPPSPLPSIALT